MNYWGNYKDWCCDSVLLALSYICLASPVRRTKPDVGLPQSAKMGNCSTQCSALNGWQILIPHRLLQHDLESVIHCNILKIYFVGVLDILITYPKWFSVTLSYFIGSTLSTYYLILSSWSQQYFELLRCTLLWMYYNLGRECTCWELRVVLFLFPTWNVWRSVLESYLWIHRLNSANNMGVGVCGSRPWVLGTLIYEAV